MPGLMESQRPRLTVQAAAEKAAREAREAAALRKNLQRRKQQARLREAPDSAPPSPSTDQEDAACR
jgi:hypothetical protein